MKLCLAFTLLLFAVLAHAQVHRCTMPDGRVVYSDTACPNAAQDAKTLQRPPTPPTPSPKSLPPPVPLPAQLTFSGNPDLDYIKASALMDNIRIKGRDCEWALKVDKSKLADCKAFLEKLQPGGEFQQIGEQVTRLNADKASMERNAAELRILLQHTQAVVRYKEFVLANLGIGGR